MKKLILLISFILFSFTSFAVKIENNEIVDKYGNKIEAREYKRIIVTDPGVIEILFKIGGEKSIVAIGKTTKSKIYPYEKVEKLQSIGSISNLNLEKIVLVGFNGLDGKEVTMSKLKDDINEIRDSKSTFI